MGCHPQLQGTAQTTAQTTARHTRIPAAAHTSTGRQLVSTRTQLAAATTGRHTPVEYHPQPTQLQRIPWIETETQAIKQTMRPRPAHTKAVIEMLAVCVATTSTTSLGQGLPDRPAHQCMLPPPPPKGPQASGCGAAAPQHTPCILPPKLHFVADCKAYVALLMSCMWWQNARRMWMMLPNPDHKLHRRSAPLRAVWLQKVDQHKEHTPGLDI